MTFRPAAVRPRALIFADGQTVRVELVSLDDNAGHALPEPVKWQYKVRSPLKMEPAEPDGEGLWYVTPPRVWYEPGDGERQAYSWAIPPAQDEHFRRGYSINEFRVEVSKEGEKTPRKYVKHIRLIKSAPKVVARVTGRNETGGPVVALAHDGYALDPGGLRMYLYSDAEFADLIAEGPFDITAPHRRRYAKLKAAIPEALSMRLVGMFRVAKAGKCEIGIIKGVRDGSTLQVFINGEKVIDVESFDTSHLPSCKVFLTAGFHRIEIRCGLSRDNPGIPRMKGSGISLEPLYHLRDLARLEYQVGGKEWRVYTKPFALPEGGTFLTRVTDLAGHRKEQEHKVAP